MFAIDQSHKSFNEPIPHPTLQHFVTETCTHVHVSVTIWFTVCNIMSGPDITLQWRHNGHDGVSNHQPHHCLLNRLFGRRSKNTPKLRVTGLCAGNSPWTGEFPAQMTSNAENVSIWWRHHGIGRREAACYVCCYYCIIQSAHGLKRLENVCF